MIHSSIQAKKEIKKIISIAIEKGDFAFLIEFKKNLTFFFKILYNIRPFAK